MASSETKRGNWDKKTVTKADTGTAIVGEACLYGGVYITTDGANNPTITIHDNPSAASGEEPLPTNTYKASNQAIEGLLIAWPGMGCDGLFLTFTSDGTAKMTVLFRKLSDL